MTHSADKITPSYKTAEMPEMITISRDKLMICAKDAEAHMYTFALNVMSLMEQTKDKL